MYLSWLYDYSQRYGLEILAYCLMMNHIHLVVLPRKSESLSLTLRSCHMRYSQMINGTFGWTGHLWQGRFFSTALDDPHLYAAVRYVERNPLRAGMVKRAEEYKWSSAAFHLGLREDKLIKSQTMWGKVVEDWAKELELPQDEETVEKLRKRTHSGYPCGDDDFIERLSQLLGRPLVRQPRGRPRKY